MNKSIDFRRTRGRERLLRGSSPVQTARRRTIRGGSISSADAPISLTRALAVWQARPVLPPSHAQRRSLGRSLGAWWSLGRLCVLGLSVLGIAAGCTIEVGENIVQPNTQLSEDYFYCRIQPDVVEAASCATGAAGDSGGCHLAQSSLRLVDTTGTTRPACTGADMGQLAPGAVVPPEYLDNFQRVQFTLGPDAESSPFYRRPTGMDSHPRRAVDMAQEMLILDWFGSAL